MKFQKKYLFVGDSFNFADGSIFFFFFEKVSSFTKIIPLLKEIVRELCFRFFVLTSFLVRQKAASHGNISFTDHASNIRPSDFYKLDLKCESHRQASLTLLCFRYPVSFPSFISISSLVLELWHFSFIRDWPEIRKLEIHASGFCPITWD